MSNWKEYKLEEVGLIVTGSTPSTSIKEYWEGDIPFYSPADFTGNLYCQKTEKSVSEKAYKLSRGISANTIMFACIASIGKMALSLHPGLTNQQINSIMPYSWFDYRYVYYMLLFSKSKFINLAPQTTIPIINKTDFSNFSFLFPPLPHQRKIARILTTVDNIIEKTEAAIAKYKDIKQGMMHDLFTRGIDVKTGKLRPKFEDAPQLYKESELGWIPKEWEVDELGTLVETYAGGTPSRSRPEYFGGDIPWVSSSEVNQPEICKTKENITREGFENSSVKWVKEGSILIAMYGATAGKISKLRINATTNQAVLACIDSKDLKSGLIFHLANFLMDKILFKVQGSGQPNLSKDIIDTTPIFKISIAEQILITDRLNTIDRLIANEKKSVDKLKQQKTGLMQDLLTGKKEVTPDPEDYANDGEPV